MLYAIDWSFGSFLFRAKNSLFNERSDNNDKFIYYSRFAGITFYRNLFGGGSLHRSYNLFTSDRGIGKVFQVAFQEEGLGIMSSSIILSALKTHSFIE